MRPTNLLALGGLIVVGIIVADFLTHPEGTKQAASGFVSIEKPAVNGLLGSTSN